MLYKEVSYDTIKGNVLIVGNGFDRLRGLKSGYVSFLNYCKVKCGFEDDIYCLMATHLVYNIANRKFSGVKPNLGINNINDFSVMYLELLKQIDEFMNSESKLKRLTPFNQEIKIIKYFTNKFGYKFVANCPDEQLLFAYNKYIEFRLTDPYFKAENPELVADKFDNLNHKNSLIFYLYLCQTGCPLCLVNRYKEYMDADGQWVDFEEIIREIAFESEITDNSGFANSYLSFIKYVYADSNVFTPLQYFKEEFVLYLDSLLSQSELYSYGNFNFNKIINFNFTSPIMPDRNQSNIIYIHGSVNDKEKCIFGYDDFISLHSKDTDIQRDRNKINRRYELSKQYQLFELNKAKTVLKLGDIFNLSILGHSIGRQDYQYYFAILDRKRDDIIIDVYWYQYEDDEGNKYDNYEMMKKALFQMLQEYEHRNGSRIVDRLSFERRIHFIEYHLADNI